MHVTNACSRVKAVFPLALLVAGGLTAALPAHAYTTIDTTPTWTANGSQSIAYWGEPDTATFGQSFTAPANVTSLNDFSFYLTNDTSGVNIPYKAYVYAWDGSEATGSALYSSGALSAGTLGAGYTTITTTPGTAVPVTPGQQYVAFFSTSGVQDAGPPTKLADWGYAAASAGTGGSFAYLNSGNDASLFTVPGGWTNDPNDLAFKADFTPGGGSPAPEPSETATLTLIGFGLSLLLAKKAVKRKKKVLPALLGLTLAGGLLPSAQAVGTWTPVPQAPQNINTALLLLDGRVMAHGADSNGNEDKTWYALTPDASGNYATGTWSQLASMAHTRLYFTSEVLRNGDVLIAGGEYSDAGNDTNTCEIYHTQTNTWGAVPTPKHRNGTTWASIGDAVSTTLADGRVMMGDILSAEQAFYDYTTNTWTPSANVKAVRSNEEAWVLQPDNSVLTVDCIGQPDSGSAPEHTERYIPASDSWLSAGSTPAGHSLVANNSAELGPGMLLPNGNTLYIGATGHTALYTTASAWVGGPDQYGTSKTLLLGAPDAPGCVEINGKALCLVAPAPTNTSSNPFPSGQHFLEYTFDATANHGSFAEAPLPSGGTGGYSANAGSFIGRMLQLPNGQVLFSNDYSQLYVYTPDSGPDPASMPSIISVSARTDGSYLIKGTQLNGLTQGAYYGDDAQMATNYPLARLMDGASHVFYGRTYNHSTMGLATGNAVVSTFFVPPATLPQGAYTLEVVANGIASTPVTFTEPLGLASLTLSTGSVSAGTLVTGTITLNGNAPVGGFKVALSTSNAAVAQPSDTFVTVPAGSNTATFHINTFAAGTVTLKGIQGRNVRTATLTVTP